LNQGEARAVSRLSKTIGRECSGEAFCENIDAQRLIWLRKAALEMSHVTVQHSIGGAGQEEARELHLVSPHPGSVSILDVVRRRLDKVAHKKQPAIPEHPVRLGHTPKMEAWIDPAQEKPHDDQIKLTVSERQRVSRSNFERQRRKPASTILHRLSGRL